MVDYVAQLRHRLTVQRNTQIRDEGGGFIEDWQDLAVDPDVWCAIDVLRFRIETDDAQRETINTHRITIRYRSDLQASDRIVDKVNNRVFLIDSLQDPDEQKKFLEVFVQESKTLMLS